MKDTPAGELAEAIRSIHRGYTQFGPGILEKMSAKVPETEPDQPQPLPPGLAELSAREREVLRLIATGAVYRIAAQILRFQLG